jgi:hypothetical protein
MLARPDGCDLAVDKIPVDLARELHQRMLEVDDLPIARGTDRSIPWPHASSAASSPPMRLPNHACPIRGNLKAEIARFGASTAKPSNLKSAKQPEKRLQLNHLEIVHGRLRGWEQVMTKSPNTTDQHIGAGVRMRRLQLGVSQTALRSIRQWAACTWVGIAATTVTMIALAIAPMDTIGNIAAVDAAR